MSESLLDTKAVMEFEAEVEVETVRQTFMRLLECFSKADMTTTTRPHCRINGKPGTYCKVLDGPDIFIWMCLTSGEAMTSKKWTCLGNFSEISRKVVEINKNESA